MNISAGNVTITDSVAEYGDGGSGGAGGFLCPGTGDDGCPPRSGTQSFMGYAVLGRRVAPEVPLTVSGLGFPV